MAFTKNSLFTFLKIAAFLFLMAFAFVAYNKADSSGADFRQSAIYQKTASTLTAIFSWAGALADLNLGRNIIRFRQVGEQPLVQEALQDSWGYISGNQVVNPEVLSENSSLDNLSNEGVEALAKGQQILNNIPNIRDISWSELGSFWQESWRKTKEIYQEFTIIY